MPLTGAHLTTALQAVAAALHAPRVGSGKVAPVDKLAELFNQAMSLAPAGSFDSVDEVAALIGTCLQESDYFRTTQEYDTTQPYSPYVGRAFVQVTHRSNYAAFGAWAKRLGLLDDAARFVNHPTELADLKWAALGGVWYFTSVKFAGKPLTAYASDILAVSRAVNMGSPTSKYTPAGMTARRAAYAAVRALGPTILPVRTPTVPAPPTAPTAPLEVPPVAPVKWQHTDRFGGQRYRSWRGGYMTPTGIAVCEAVPSPVYLSQGGLSTAVPASGQTHNGLGAYDVKVKGWKKGAILTLCADLIRSGEPAFPRGGLFGSAFFVQHVHVASSNNYSSLHPTAQAQVRDFKHSPRRNGLVGHGRYVGPSTPLGSWGGSPYNPKNVKAPAARQYFVAVDELQGLDVDRLPKSGKNRKRGFVIDAYKMVRRWGRWNVLTTVGTYYAVKDSKQTYLKPVQPAPVTPPPADQPTPTSQENPA